MTKTSQTIPELGVTMCDTFSDAYPMMNELILSRGDKQPSRYGHTMEFLDHKTTIKTPIRRCVGGFNRNVNVFFLLAEAMWIWTGRKDVGFLTVFNKKMSEFSDDGVVFHAPYGWRLRNYGKASDTIGFGSRDNFVKGDDQIEKCLLLLSDDSDNRRAVASIWNPDMDLDVKSVDIPCNDMIMFKVRGGALMATIANRSNDLHWGLPTNVFQFSYILEIMARILGTEIGTQTHNSQSLHIYDENPIAGKMHEAYNAGIDNELYKVCEATAMDFKFDDNRWWKERLNDVDVYLNQIVDNLKAMSENRQVGTEFDQHLLDFSEYHYFVYKLLSLYIKYSSSNRNDRAKIDFIREVNWLHQKCTVCDDYALLAMNFMVQRLKTREAHEEALPAALSGTRLSVQSLEGLGNY